MEVVGAVAGPGDEPGVGLRLAEGAAGVVGEDAIEGGGLGRVEGAGQAVGGDGAGGGRRRQAGERGADAEGLAAPPGVEAQVRPRPRRPRRGGGRGGP